MKTKTKQEVSSIESSPELFYVKEKYDSFTSQHNPVLRKNRITDLSTHILKVWIKRYIMYLPGDEELFGISKENNEIIVWFTYENDAEKCKTLFKEIIEQGYPRPKSIY
jgi:hypothetical protein